MASERLDANYVRLSRDIRTKVVALAERQFTSLPNYWQANEDAFVRAVVPVIQGGQRSTATLTGAWLKARLAEQGVTVSASVNLNPIVEGLRGIAPADLYRRPFEQVRYSWSQGNQITQAVRAGRNRLVTLASTDLQLAHTTTAQQLLSDTDGVEGYNRVVAGLHPCDFCRTAADWHYYRADLLPIHDGCSCIVVPAIVPPRRGTKSAAAPGTMTPAERKSYEALTQRQASLGAPKAVA
jgi:hypothetical protein